MLNSLKGGFIFCASGGTITLMPSSEKHQPGQVIEPEKDKKFSILKRGAEKDSGWQFHAEDNAPQSPASSTKKTNVESVQWTASEFIQHEKSAGWYAGLLAGAAGLAAIVYLVTEDWVSTITSVIVACVFGILAVRTPREMEFGVNERGVKMGNKFYTWGNFKSFAIVQEGNIESVWLMPLKRFMPIITLYFAPDDGPKIVNVISQFLPVEEHKMDPVDRLMQRLRF